MARSVSQETPSLKVHYRVHKIAALGPSPISYVKFRNVGSLTKPNAMQQSP
jgi:hypothetical protein